MARQTFESPAFADDDAPLDPTLVRVQARLRRLMLIAGLTLGLGILAVLGAMLYRINGLGTTPKPIASAAAVPVDLAATGLPADARLISSALDGDPAPQRFRIPRLSGHDLAAIAKPIAAPAFMRGGAALALFVSDPRQDTQVDPEAIRDLFQLTRMEANLAVALANGCSLVDAADVLGIAHNTARSHLRSIFAKTGARRQSQLVHLLHSGVQ